MKIMKLIRKQNKKMETTEENTSALDDQSANPISDKEKNQEEFLSSSGESFDLE